MHERRGGDVARSQEPALDRLATETGKGDVPYIDRRQTGVDRFESGVQRVSLGVRQRVGPEGVEIGRLVAVGLVGPKFGQRQIEKGHRVLLRRLRRTAGARRRVRS